MPTYEFACLVCQKEFEAELKISEAAKSECPNCRVMCENRLISSKTTFALKGSGWGSDNYSKTSG